MTNYLDISCMIFSNKTQNELFVSTKVQVNPLKFIPMYAPPI
jgi:hypothetical protein